MSFYFEHHPPPSSPSRYHSTPLPLQLSTVEYHSSCYLSKECKEIFPNIWKTLFLCTNKNCKQLVDNYRLASLLLICSKIFEKMLFDSIYEFLDESCLLNSNQSRFRPDIMTPVYINL